MHRTRRRLHGRCREMLLRPNLRSLHRRARPRTRTVRARHDGANVRLRVLEAVDRQRHARFRTDEVSGRLYAARRMSADIGLRRAENVGAADDRAVHEGAMLAGQRLRQRRTDEAMRLHGRRRLLRVQLSLRRLRRCGRPCRRQGAHWRHRRAGPVGPAVHLRLRRDGRRREMLRPNLLLHRRARPRARTVRADRNIANLRQRYRKAMDRQRLPTTNQHGVAGLGADRRRGRMLSALIERRTKSRRAALLRNRTPWRQRAQRIQRLVWRTHEAVRLHGGCRLQPHGRRGEALLLHRRAGRRRRTVRADRYGADRRLRHRETVDRHRQTADVVSRTELRADRRQARVHRRRRLQAMIGLRAYRGQCHVCRRRRLHALLRDRRADEAMGRRRRLQPSGRLRANESAARAYREVRGGLRGGRRSGGGRSGCIAGATAGSGSRS